jgi:hypothetical protein
MHNPGPQRPVEDRLQGGREPAGIARHEFPCPDRVLHEVAQAPPEALRTGEGVPVELEIVEIELQEGQVVGHGFRSVAQEGHALAQAQQGRERRPVAGAQVREDVVGAAARVPGRGQEERAL